MEALEAYWQKSITPEQICERDGADGAGIAKQAQGAARVFEALGNDPFLIAECLARPVLSRSGWC